MRTFISNHQNHHSRAHGLGHTFIRLAGVLALGVATTIHADEPDATSMAYARQLAIGVCGTCHGPHGNSTQPKFPRIAGQNANYLASQLKAFLTSQRVMRLTPHRA